MKRVVGIGGIFIKSNAPEELKAWYRTHLDALRAEGCDVDTKTEESEFGKFGWVMDPDGNRVELWEPPPGPTEG
ncbi:MAG: hypothetical protein U9Q95_01115 [Candidatus Eisenbacteria bacterium]|nr:hypothetical protein [Candidatus Eisenbacteria bacterium]